MQTTSDDPIPLSALQHYAYCPRQFALIHLEQSFSDNIFTQRGQAVHTQVDEPGSEREHGVRVERALPLHSEKLGLIGKADVVEFYPDGRVLPVEYKHGRLNRSGLVGQLAQTADAVQLCAQALCLEEMLGVTILEGAIYQARSRKRRKLKLDSPLREQVLVIIDAIRSLRRIAKLPTPAADARCEACSLKELCQPEAILAGERLLEADSAHC